MYLHTLSHLCFLRVNIEKQNSWVKGNFKVFKMLLYLLIFPRRVAELTFFIYLLVKMDIMVKILSSSEQTVYIMTGVHYFSNLPKQETVAEVSSLLP